MEKYQKSIKRRKLHFEHRETNLKKKYHKIWLLQEKQKIYYNGRKFKVEHVQQDDEKYISKLDLNTTTKKKKTEVRKRKEQKAQYKDDLIS